MSDLKIYIVHDSNERAAAAQVKAALDNEMQAAVAGADRPDIVLRDNKRGFEDLPTSTEMGPLSLVLVLLPRPKQPFKPDEHRLLTAFLQGYGPDDVRLVPISLELGRDKPPEPLDGLKSFPLHDLNDAQLVGRLSTRLLNLMCLRVASTRRKLFLSYRTSDGAPWAQRVQKLLEELGYKVWRDESRDRDGVTAIPPGSSAQKEIHDAILRHGFVLVIDTMQAPESSWVREEIDTAIKYMLPILPLVIHDYAGTANPVLEPEPRKRGGRFRELSESQHEVRIKLDRRKTLEQSIDNDDWKNPDLATFLAELETGIRDRLLENLRARRELIQETQDRLLSLQFRWSDILPECLLFGADRSLDTADCPELHFRMLVQCAPYDTLLDQTVSNLCLHFRAQIGPYQYAVLVHRTSAYTPEKRRLLHACGGHVLVLRPDELSKLTSVFHIA